LLSRTTKLSPYGIGKEPTGKGDHFAFAFSPISISRRRQFYRRDHVSPLDARPKVTTVSQLDSGLTLQQAKAEAVR
jgi:hypothetical protein